jgi:hypothetical protein
MVTLLSGSVSMRALCDSAYGGERRAPSTPASARPEAMVIERFRAAGSA